MNQLHLIYKKLKNVLLKYYPILGIIALVLAGSIPTAFGYQQVFDLGPGEHTDYYVSLKEYDLLKYEILVSGGANNDVVAQIVDPNFQILAEGFVNDRASGSINVHPDAYNFHMTEGQKASVLGQHIFRFGNSMSVVSSKSVTLSYTIENTKPVEQSTSGGSSYNNSVSDSGPVILGWLIFIGIIGVMITITALALRSRKRRERKGTGYSQILDDGKNNKPSSDKNEKKLFGEKCIHKDSWIRKHRNRGKELGSLLTEEKKSYINEESKPVESQQNLDNYVAQSTLENNSEDKETINDIEKNEKALGVLKERLAKGEISVKEYQEIKKEISS